MNTYLNFCLCVNFCTPSKVIRLFGIFALNCKQSLLIWRQFTMMDQTDSSAPSNLNANERAGHLSFYNKGSKKQAAWPMFTHHHHRPIGWRCGAMTKAIRQNSPTNTFIWIWRPKKQIERQLSGVVQIWTSPAVVCETNLIRCCVQCLQKLTKCPVKSCIKQRGTEPILFHSIIKSNIPGNLLNLLCFKIRIDVEKFWMAGASNSEIGMVMLVKSCPEGMRYDDSAVDSNLNKLAKPLNDSDVSACQLIELLCPPNTSARKNSNCKITIG